MGERVLVRRTDPMRMRPDAYAGVGMKTVQKYSELIVFVFYIMNRFLT
jgi:hypothetical protein